MKNCPKCAAKKAAASAGAAKKGAANPLVETIAKTVAYQKDNIVSREIIHQKSGTVTVFAFDAGQGLSEHTAPFDALVQVLEGSVEIRIDGRPHRLKAGQMIVMPEDHPHALKALTRFKMMLTMIRR
ncbi:cupin domain-containing protein [bacterium]|nr:cupin domain-containing protein [bacterium]